MSNKTIRAIGLSSGGLDSQLAICVLKAQGIEVEVITFDSPFYSPEASLKASKQLDVKLHLIDFTEEIVGLVNNPPHGFGKYMNPCIDCHALMFRRAGEIMVKKGFDFIFTGEVLNQRPMSQNRRSLGMVAKDSSFEDLVLRPLSAQLLEPTKPEREGWVDREKLLALSGRSRKPQFELAKQYGLKEYPTPAGGCRLTEPHYSKRLAELKSHEGLQDAHALTMLRYGRHFRLSDDVKFILGRHADDNAKIEDLIRKNDIELIPLDIPGPTGILPQNATKEQIAKAASILVSYIKYTSADTVTLKIKCGNDEYTIEANSMPTQQTDTLMIAK